MRAPGPGSLARRLLWFVALWCAGVLSVGGLAYLLRIAIGA